MDTIFELIPEVGGTAGFLVALYLIGKLALDGRERHAAAHLKTPATKAEVADSLIDQLQESLQAAHDANLQISGRVENLEIQNATLYQKLRDQRREYEEELDRLNKKLTELTKEFAAFRAKIRGQQDVGD